MSEFIKGKRYRIIGDTCIPNKNGDILIFKREYYDDARIGVFNDGNVDHFYYYKRFDPTPLPDPIEYKPEVVHCTWCGEPVMFPESHRYLCIHSDKPSYWMCGKNLYLCDKCKEEENADVCMDHAYCSEHVEQHRPHEEDESDDDGTDYTQAAKYDGESNQESLSVCLPINIDDTANAGIAAVMFGSKPRQMYAEKTWKGPSDEELQKKTNVEEERKRYER